MSISSVGGLGVNLAGGNLLQNNYAPTTGNLLVISCGLWNSATSTNTATLTDSRGNTVPSPTVNGFKADAHTTAYVWIIPNCIGGTGNFQVNTGLSGSDINLDIWEYSGTSTTGALDGTPAIAEVTSGETISSGNITTTHAGSMLVGCYLDTGGAHTVTLSSGFTGRINNQNTDGITTEICDSLNVAPGTYDLTVSWTSGATPGATVALIGIQAGSGGGSNHPPLSVIQPGIGMLMRKLPTVALFMPLAWTLNRRMKAGKQ